MHKFEKINCIFLWRIFHDKKERQTNVFHSTGQQSTQERRRQINLAIEGDSFAPSRKIVIAWVWWATAISHTTSCFGRWQSAVLSRKNWIERDLCKFNTLPRRRESSTIPIRISIHKVCMYFAPGLSGTWYYKYYKHRHIESSDALKWMYFHGSVALPFPPLGIREFHISVY